MGHLFVRYMQFRWFWWGSTLSMLGGRALSVTYPLMAYTLTGSPQWTGWVVFASTVPGLICYIPAGAVIDRVGPRRVLITSEATRFVIMVALVLLWFCDGLHIGWVVAFALIEGGLAVMASVAESAHVPNTVEDHDLDTALAAHETSSHGAVLLGRQVGGLLYGLLPIVPFIINAIAFAGSARFYGRLPREASERSPRRIELRAGFAALRSNRFLRLATIIVACTNFMVQCLIVVFLTIATRDELSPVWAGMFLAASGVGGIVGGLLWPTRARISTRIGDTVHSRWVEWMGLARRPSVMLVHVWACTAAIGLILASGQRAPSFGGALLIIGLVGGLSNVTLRSAWSRVDPGVRARVVSASRIFSYGAVAIGPLVGSLLVPWIDTGATMWILLLSMIVLTLVTTLIHLRNSVTSGPVTAARLQPEPSVPEGALPAPVR
ncbi:MFS transporter [Nonomuraea sp. NPDC048826]|uniref:MFS transporter n=1 Tax=Nonomuraea sp. NPDC048826 TaxID=3364347 RepID=UPI00371F3852